MTSAGEEDPWGVLPVGWSLATPRVSDASELTTLLRRHEEHARGWSGASHDSVLVALTGPGSRTRENLLLRDADARIRGWASAHDRAAGRMLLTVLVDWDLEDDRADRAAAALLGWADEAARRVGSRRGLGVQQVDSGAFADDVRQQRWLRRAGFEKVRVWWQMTRPVMEDEADSPVETREGVRIRQVRRQETGMPDEDDLRLVHEVLESAFADHFNSHEETFDEFVTRLRGDPGHRWDHWWVAELVEGPVPEPAGALVGSVSPGRSRSTGASPGTGSSGDRGRPDDREPGGSYVEYIGVLPAARGRGVATSLLRTVIADAAANGRDRVGLEVDAESATGADGLYRSLGWTTSHVTQSWHKDVPVPPTPSALRLP